MARSFVLLALLALLSPISPSAAAADQVAQGPAARELAELLELYTGRDFFALRERLGGVPEEPPAGPAAERFFAAAVQHAFNRPELSNRTLATLVEDPSPAAEPSPAPADDLPAGLAAEARRLRMANHLRRHRYAAALEAAEAILRAPAGAHPPELVADVRNTALLLAALREVPPQRAEARATSRVALDANRRLPVKIGDADRRLALDTGANFSVLMRSEAEALGLTIRPVGLAVATSLGRHVRADVAVAERVTIGNVDFRHVVFLVFPDELLSFPDGTRIPGLVGFPMVEAMGELSFRVDGVLEIPAQPPKRRPSNLALDELEPLVQARWSGEELLCRLDTGANRSFFYERFYSRHRKRVERLGREETVQVGGVGGVRDVRVYTIRTFSLHLASADVILRDVNVYTEPLPDLADRNFDCNVGLDALQRFYAYVINFRDMALVLEGTQFGRRR